MKIESLSMRRKFLKKFNIERREIESSRLKFLSCLLHEQVDVYFNPFQRGNYVFEYNSMNRLLNRAKSFFLQLLCRKDCRCSPLI